MTKKSAGAIRISPTAAATPFAGLPGERWRLYVLGATTALYTATLMIPSEAAAETGSHAVLQMLWCLLLAAWAVMNAVQPVARMNVGRTGLAVAALIGWHTLSGLVMLNQGDARATLHVVWVWIGYGCGALLLRQTLQSAVERRALLAVMAALGVALAAHGYYQYFVALPRLRAQVEKDYQADPQGFCQREGVDPNPESAEHINFFNRVTSKEPLATFSLANSLAGFLAPWLVAAGGIAVVNFGVGGSRKALVGGVLAVLLLAGCLLLTKSRTGVLAAGCGAALLGLYGRERGWRLDWRIPAAAAAGLTLIGLGIVWSGGLDWEVLSEAPKSILYRLEYWRATAAMIADHPLFGCGPGNFQDNYAAYKLPQASETVADPHNFLLEIWATAGTPAIVALLALIGCTAWEAARIAARRGDASGSADTGEASPLPLYLGAGAGLALGAWLSLLTATPIHTDSMAGHIGLGLCGLPLAASFLWLVHGWVLRGPLLLSQPAIILAVLAINLLAAGAFAFPGVANTGWISLVILLTAGGSAGGWSLGRPWSLGVVASTILLALACFLTEYNPTLQGGAATMDADILLKTSDPQAQAEAEQKLAAAIQADPLAPAAWRLLTDLRFRQWLARRDPRLLERFEDAAANLRRREPHSQVMYERLGQWYVQLYLLSGETRFLDQALRDLERAVQLYPNSALGRAQWAWALHGAARHSEARRQAERALELSDLNPHRGYNLKKSPPFPPWPAQGESSPPKPWESSEQQMLFLRSWGGRAERFRGREMQRRLHILAAMDYAEPARVLASGMDN